MAGFETRPLGRTSLRATVLGLGTGTLGGHRVEVPRQEAETVVRTAWSAGVRYFDTAPFYGFGRACRILGDALRELPRDEWVLSTKVGRLLRPEPNLLGRGGPGRPMPFERRSETRTGRKTGRGSAHEGAAEWRRVERERGGPPRPGLVRGGRPQEWEFRLEEVRWRGGRKDLLEGRPAGRLREDRHPAPRPRLRQRDCSAVVRRAATSVHPPLSCEYPGALFRLRHEQLPESHRRSWKTGRDMDSFPAANAEATMTNRLNREQSELRDIPFARGSANPRFSMTRE